MTDRMSALRRAQIGKQSALGSAVAATIELVGLTAEAEPMPSIHSYGPQGQLFDTLEDVGQEYATIKLAGQPDYNEIAWLLSMIFGDVVPTTPGGGTNSRQRLWTPAIGSLWTPMIATLELGESVRAEQYPDMIMKSFQFMMGQDKFEQTGDAFAGKIVDNHTLTPSLSGLAEVPIKGEQTKIYLDTTSGGLGGTQLTRYFEHQVGLSDVFAPEFPGGASTSGYGLYVLKKPKAAGQLTLEADSVGMGNLVTLRAGSYNYLRVHSIGPIIEGSIHYELIIDLAIKFMKPSAFKAVGSASGLTGNDWPYAIVTDPTWNGTNAEGQALQITLINAVPSF